MWAATLPLEDSPWHRRMQSQEAFRASHIGAVAKSGSTDAMAAASAKQSAVTSSMSKSAGAPPSLAPWHRSAPLPAPPSSSAPWQKPPPLPAPPKAQWPGGAPPAPPALPAGPVPLADPVAGLGSTASTQAVAKSPPVPTANPATISEYRSRLVAIYSVRNPSNVAKVDYLLGKYKGQENFLYNSVCAKYQIPETWDGRQPVPRLPGDPEAPTKPGPASAPAVQPATAAPKLKASLSDKAPWEILKVNTSKASEGTDGTPPWAREAKRKSDAKSKESAPKAASKEVAKAKNQVDAVEDLEAMSEVLAALQTLTEDMGDPSSPSKPAKPPAEEPAAKSQAKENGKQSGKQSGQQPEKQPEKQPEEQPEKQPEKRPEKPPENQEPNPAEQARPEAPAEADADAQAVPESEAPRRRPPTPPRPKRKKPPKEAEAGAPPPKDPRRRPVSDDEEVVVVSVDGRDAGGDMDEDAQLGEQMRKALGANLEATRREEPAQMALPVVPVMEPVTNEVDLEEAEAVPAKAVAPEAVDAKRLAAAAAAARGLAARAQQSDSDSDSEYSSGSEEEEEEAQPVMALPVPTGGPEPPLNGKAQAKTTESNTPHEDQALRKKLLGQIFEQLSDFCGTPKRSTVKGMQRFVTMVGFEGSDNEWLKEYKSLCKEWKVDPEKGFTQEAFNKMVNDASKRGCYCTNEELKIILDKILSTPRVPKVPKVRKQPPSPPAPPKKQKVEVQFQ